MRQIKFRGKSLISGEWVYGGIEIQSEINSVHITVDVGGIESVPVDPETVGQYTGLKDKNGVEIWEGDIIRDMDGNLQVVRWYDMSHYHPNFDGPAYPTEECEVIGNIHENPELVK